MVSADQLTDYFKVSLESGRSVYAKNLFDSRSPSIRDGEFLQHFRRRVHSETPIFDEETATLMDFRVPQDEGIHFIYLLPFNSKQALVESTVYLLASYQIVGMKNRFLHICRPIIPVQLQM